MIRRLRSVSKSQTVLFELFASGMRSTETVGLESRMIYPIIFDRDVFVVC